MITIIAYLISTALIYFAVTGMLQMLFTGIISIATFRMLGIPLTLLLGAIAAWLALAAGWYYLEGGYIPFTVLACGFIFLFIHGAIEGEALTPESRKMMAAEAWSIVVVTGILLWQTDPIRWY